MSDTWSSLVGGLDAAVIATFGRAVTYTPQATGVAIAITAVWEPPEDAADTSPYGHLFVRLADLPGDPARGDQVQVEGFGTFTVFDIKPDGFGAAQLTLRK